MLNEIVDLFTNKKFSVTKISKILKINKVKIKRIIIESGLEPKKNRCGANKLSESDIQKILDLSNQNISIIKIAKELKLYPSAIKKILDNRGIIHTTNQRDFNFNEQYFNIIDSKEKATVLGFIYADGSVDEGDYSLRIHLAEEDLDVLERIKGFLKADYNISKIDKVMPTRQNTVLLRFNSKILCSCLVKIGCVQCKSLIKEFPKLDSPELVKSFIYGYFLGNGWISYKINPKNGRRVYDVGFATNNNMAVAIKAILAEQNVNSYIINTVAGPDHASKKLCTSGNLQIRRFLDWLFTDEIYLMKRKTDIYNDLVEYVNNPHSVYDL